MVGLANALGILVFDDGSTFELTGDSVVGRDPEIDPRVIAGQARPIVLDDPDATVSRVHAEVRFVNGDVQLVDRGSTNGTHVWDESLNVWARLVPGEPRTLVPGGCGSIGPRMFVYEAPSEPAPQGFVTSLIATEDGAPHPPDRADGAATGEAGARQLPLPMALTRLMIKPPRAPLWCTPERVGLAFEDVVFDATDGVEIHGWFVPRAGEGPGPAVVFVHGWLWNRLGNVAGRVPFTDYDVDFLPATKGLHDAGYHVLLIDLSNHGQSGSRFPVTYGPWEARDYAGAMAYLRSRRDVDSSRLGALGCSMGGNTLLYGTPDCQPVKALLAIQPAVLPNFNRRFARDLLGPSGPTMVKSAEGLYVVKGAPRPRKHNPAIPAKRLGATIVQYVQGTGDRWGSMEDVEAMVAATPNALPLVRFPSAGRYEGYAYVSEAVDDVVGFFRDHV